MLQSLTFPQGSFVNVLAIALLANGNSSYRDVTSISALLHTKWNSKITIITDNKEILKRTRYMLSDDVSVIEISSKDTLLHEIKFYISNLKPGQDLFFTLSSHGYTRHVPFRACYEISGMSEYIMIKNECIMDYELLDVINNGSNVNLTFALIDTCHSGTMLDLDYISYDGTSFIRSKTIQKKNNSNIICISACNDYETVGEDISTFGGWGGKLICYFLDYMEFRDSLNMVQFFKHILNIFTNQKS